MAFQSPSAHPFFQEGDGTSPSIRVESSCAEEIVVAVDGLLKFDTIDAVRRGIETLLDRTPTARLTLDCAMVDFVDSQALAMLIGLSRRTRTQGGELALRNPQPMVQKLLHMTRMDSLFTIFQTEAGDGSSSVPVGLSPRAPLKPFIVPPAGS